MWMSSKPRDRKLVQDESHSRGNGNFAKGMLGMIRWIVVFLH